MFVLARLTPQLLSRALHLEMTFGKYIVSFLPFSVSD